MLSENQILKTRNYSIFKRLEGNRPVIKSKFMKIVKSIEDVGWISNPITVNRDYEVIDGQHRLAALKYLNMPVEYIVVDDVGINECVSMNITSTNWGLLDYINSYAERGNQSYSRLLDLFDSFHLPLNVICTALFNTLRFHSNTIKNGTLQITMDEANNAKIRLRKMQTLMNIIDPLAATNRTQAYVQQALLVILSFDEVDQVRLETALKKHFVVPNNGTWKNVDEVVLAIENAYNAFMKQDSVVMIYNIYRELVRKNGLRGVNKVRKVSDLL